MFIAESVLKTLGTEDKALALIETINSTVHTVNELLEVLDVPLLDVNEHKVWVGMEDGRGLDFFYSARIDGYSVWWNAVMQGADEKFISLAIFEDGVYIGFSDTDFAVDSNSHEMTRAHAKFAFRGPIIEKPASKKRKARDAKAAR